MIVYEGMIQASTSSASMDENGALEASRSLLDELDEEPEGGDRGHEHLRDVVVGETVVLEREVLGQEAELGVEGVNQRGRHDGGQGHVHGVVEVHLVDGGDESEEPDGRSADPELGHCEVRGGRSAIWEGANAGRMWGSDAFGSHLDRIPA